MTQRQQDFPVLVWNPDREIPRHKHHSTYEASKEAERLAKMHPGQQFLVMVAVGVAEVPEQKIYRPLYDDGVPFCGRHAVSDAVNHPAHYGGEEDPYEAIKVIEAWKLGFCLGNTVKYISRAGKKDDILQDLKKARWYLDREISNLAKVRS